MNACRKATEKRNRFEGELMMIRTFTDKITNAGLQPDCPGCMIIFEQNKRNERSNIDFDTNFRF